MNTALLNCTTVEIVARLGRWTLIRAISDTQLGPHAWLSAGQETRVLTTRLRPL